MYKVFNKNALTRKERMKNAIVAGVGLTIILFVIYVLVSMVISVPDFFYMPLGFAIGYAIQYFGHGVQLRFSVLAAVLILILMLACDMFAFGGDFTSLFYYLFNQGLGTIYNVAYRAVAVYLAFTNARIVRGR